MKSVIAAVVVAIAVGFAVWTFTRDSSAPPVSPVAAPSTTPIPEVAGRTTAGRPVIFIGLDGADWTLLDSYIAKGSMPALAALVREGTRGTVKTLGTPLSPLIWNSIVTGVSPLEHRILDFLRVNPATGQREPITSDERRVPAVWNIATYGGRRVSSFGFWATWPAEPVNGLLVSDRLFTFLYKETSPPPGVVFPREREQWARDALQRAEQDVTIDDLRKYLPALTDAEYREALAATSPYSHPVSALRRILVETSVYDSLAFESLERDKPDLLLAYFQGTDTIGHVFAPYAPPRQPAVTQADYDRYNRVPELYFKEIDRLLARYVDAARKHGSVIFLISDHGFKWGDGRPTTMSSFANTTAAKWHTQDGIYLLWGPGIQKAPAPANGKVEQAAATLLALAGLPPGKGLAGPPLPGVAPVAGDPVDYRRFYSPSISEATVAAAGRGSVDEETMAKLRALGYIGATGAGGQVKGSRTAGSFNNEALLLREEKRIDEAIGAYEQALAVDPALASAAWNLSDLLFTRPDSLDRSDALLVRAYVNGLPDGAKFLIGRAIGYQRAGDTARSVKLLSDALAGKTDDADVWLFRGRYRIEAKDCAGARSDFVQATRRAPDNPATHTAAGLAAVCLGDAAAARESFEQSLKLQPNQPQVREYLRKLR